MGPGPQADNHLPQSPFPGSIFLDNDILYLSLIFLRSWYCSFTWLISALYKQNDPS
jgi:hypothetical protein